MSVAQPLARCALLAVALSGCEGRDCEPWPAKSSLTEKEQRHTCIHVAEGPFGELSDGDAIDNLHMSYTVTLTPKDGGNKAALRWVARATTTHVLYVSGELPVTIRDEASGEALCAARASADLCEGMLFAELVDLADGQAVTVEMGPTSASTISIVGERK